MEEFPTNSRWVGFNPGLPAADPEEAPQQEHHYPASITKLFTHSGLCLLWKQPLLSIHLWPDLKLPVLSILCRRVRSIHRAAPVRRTEMSLTRSLQNPWQQQNPRCVSWEEQDHSALCMRGHGSVKRVFLLRPFEYKHQNTSFVLLNVKCEMYLLRRWCPWQRRAPYVLHLFSQSLKASPPCVTTLLS